MENQGIGDWVHRRRVKSAASTALVAGDVERTYAELAERIDRLADAFAARGITSGDRVAYLGPNAPEFLETLFAVTSLGAVFVPLNTRLAPAELGYQLQDSATSLIVHAAESAASLPADLAIPRVVVGEDGPEGFETVLASGSPEHVDRPVTLDMPAAILYTSGTTGKPKGAILSHGNLTWNAINTIVDYDVTSRQVALMVSPLFHVAALGMGTLPTLLKGGTLVLQPKVDPAEVLAAIERHGVTSLSGVPTTFQMLAEHPNWESTDLSTLESLTCGGSAVPGRVAAAYEKRGLAFSSGYGMTESSPGATSLSPLHASRKSTTSGLPHFFTDVRIVDESGAEVATGELGEIEVLGPNVFLGYWGLPEATAGAFNGSWLRTGDVGFVDDEGFLTIADRSKDMFISGGENVYPAEVEQLLMELPQIESVALIGVPDERWGEVGKAIVVPAAGASVSHDDVTRHLDGRVARYKIPKSTEVVDELPRTASGKVRKNILREQFGA